MPKLKPRLLVGTPSELPQQFGQWFRAYVERALGQRNIFGFCVPGGSVAKQLLPALIPVGVDWHKVHVFFGDERAVPQDHPDSNFALVKSALLSHIAIPEQNVHRMRVDAASLSEAAEAYASELSRTLGGPPLLDLALLGVGEDGHVCSLFPGHIDEGSLVAVVTDAPKPPARRLTLGYKALAEARTLAVAAMGREKAPIVARALTDPALPVHRVLRAARESWLVLDQAAAHELLEA